MARQLEWPFRLPERAVQAIERAVRERAVRARAPVDRAVRRRAGDLAEGARELERFVAEVGGGRIEPPRVEGERVVVALRARDGERYLLEMQATRYLAAPLRCRFVDESGESAAAAWPADHPLGPFRPPSFICTPPTAEFYVYHPERKYEYGEGSFQNTVATVFAALHGRGYAGRHRAGRPAPDAEGPRGR